MILVNDVIFNEDSKTIPEGTCAYLRATVSPANATVKQVCCCSSDPEIVSIERYTGRMCAYKEGSVVITATSMDGSKIEDTCVVTVVPNLSENYVSSQSWSPTCNCDYCDRQILSNAQIEKIRELMPFYQKTAREKGISWKILAAIHYRESTLLKGATNKYGPYQTTVKTYPVKNNYSNEEFQAATDDAAEHILTKVKAAKLSLFDLDNDDNVKEIFFRYNGVSSKYKQQAIDLGFTNEQANNGEGSPYVMNKADLLRDTSREPTKSNNTWGQIKVDGGPIEYPANTYHYGAFVVYKAL